MCGMRVIVCDACKTLRLIRHKGALTPINYNLEQPGILLCCGILERLALYLTHFLDIDPGDW